METFPWYGSLFLGLVGLIVLAIGGILILAVVDAIRIASTKHPSRFNRSDRLKSFQRVRLPEIAESLNMEVIEQIPRKLEEAVEATAGTLGLGGISDLLSRSYGEGTLSLCNVQKNLSQSKHWQDGSSTNWTKVQEFTCLIFMGGKETEFPKFNLAPNEHSLMIKLFNQRTFGALQHEDDPEFHRRILIGTTKPDEVGSLLTPGVRNVLKKNADLRTAVCGPYIVVYDYGNIGKGIRFLHSRRDDGAIVDCEVIAAECWPQFYEAALEVIESLRQAHSASNV